MEPVRPEFVPDPDLDSEAMEALQRDIAEAAVFADDVEFVPERACVDPDADATDGENVTDGETRPEDAPVVAGVDQAFLDDRAVSAVVLTRGGEVLERVHAVAQTEIPYIPGLLAFREGGPILAAFHELDREPDVALFDGSGRIHYRQAGLATHVGVTLDFPAIGVAKRLLCGEPEESLEGRKLPVGSRVPILADEEVDAPGGTPIGHAVQTRQFEGRDRHVNPLYVSPGHRVGAETAADLVLRCCDGYKLPEPIRLADRHADEVKAEYA